MLAHRRLSSTVFIVAVNGAAFYAIAIISKPYGMKRYDIAIISKPYGMKRYEFANLLVNS